MKTRKVNDSTPGYGGAIFLLQRFTVAGEVVAVTASPSELREKLDGIGFATQEEGFEITVWKFDVQMRVMVFVFEIPMPEQFDGFLIRLGQSLGRSARVGNKRTTP